MLSLYLLILALWPQEQQKPLPELGNFLTEFRKTLHSDDKLLSQYTYTETETEISLDGKGKPKKTETNVYQMIHGAEEWQTYRRQIVKKGVALREKELEKQDREQKELVEKVKLKRARQSEEKLSQAKAKADREEEEELDDVFNGFDIRMVGREVRDGHSTILLTFKPKPNYKPKSSDGKMLQHIGGRVWVAEDDHELARVEMEIIDSISIGAGLLAKVQKGSTAVFERHKINNEIWLPVKAEVSMSARILLLKGLNMKQTVEYSDHKKYSVDSQLKFGDVVDQPTQ